MTEVYVDGVKLDFEDTENNSTIAELVAAVEKELTGIRRYVDALFIDGQAVEDEGLTEGWRGSARMSMPICEAAAIKLQTAGLDEMALKGLETIKEHAGVICTNIRVCADSLRRGLPVGEGVASIVESSVEVVKTAEALSKAAASYGLELFRSDPSQCCRSLIEKLDSLSAAASNGDHVALADILEYELAPLLEGMEEIACPGAA